MFPGETLRTDIWKLPGNRIAFQVTVEDRNEFAITHGVAVVGSAKLRSGKQPASSQAGKVSEIFRALSAIFTNLPNDQKADLMKKGVGIYRFDVKEGDLVSSFVINLKDGNGSISAGKPPAQDITIELGADALVQLLSGKMKGQSAFMKGLVKVKGNMMLATKLDIILSALGAQLKSKL